MSADALPGLRTALDLARNHHAYYRRLADSDGNQTQFEDGQKRDAMAAHIRRLESAIAEVKRQRGPVSILDGGW